MMTAALQWTDAAREGLERYFITRLTPARLEGADAAEVRADLMTHLEEELSAEGVAVVTLEDLRRTLARMGEVLAEPAATGDSVTEPVPMSQEPELNASAKRAEQNSVAEPDSGASRLLEDASRSAGLPGVFCPKPAPVRPVTSFWITMAGLWLPLTAFIFEVITRGCVGMLFDPMPDWEHHLAVVLVPLTAWLYLRGEKEKGPAWIPRILPWLAGAALGVSAFYMFWFLPVVPMAPFGILLAGTGLLALAPLLAFTAMLQLRRRIKKFHSPGALSRLRWSFWLTLVILLALEVPVVVTESAVNGVAVQGASAESCAGAARTIRTFGSEDVLLKIAAGAHRSMTGSMRQTMQNELNRNLGRPWWVAPEDQLTAARQLYFRVTGVPFDGKQVSLRSVPLIENTFNKGMTRERDEDRGGRVVAGRIDGLGLGDSRMDWHCEEASGLTWGEWTLVFTNSSQRPEEARCRVALPPGGFVSRVTLWVNGEPQEAAYSTVSRVRAAYEAVAVKERRDPVLVTQTDAGSVLVQAFPVPAGGQLKTRISFTVPAGVDGRVWLPSLVERNFKVDEATSLPLWVQADRGAVELPAALKPHAALESGAPTVTGSLRAADFTAAGTSFVWKRQQSVPVVFCEDPLVSGPERKIVVRTDTGPQVFKPGALAWVIDTSGPMAARREQINQALGRISVPGKTAVFLPGDTARNLVSASDGSVPPMNFEGGRDNSPALAAALEWLRGQPDGCLIWVHGPQPLDGESKASLDQVLDRGTTPLTVVDVPVAIGENRLSGTLIGRPRVKVLTARIPVAGNGEVSAASGTSPGSAKAGILADAVESVFRQRGGAFSTLPAGAAVPDGAVRVSDSLARWMAREEAFRLGMEHPAEASKMAAGHQIVTPWSGAVVLEKAEDYSKNNLTQADVTGAQVVPTIPEPSGAVLLVLSASHFLFRRRRAAR